MVYPYKKSNFEVLNFGGFDTSRDAEENSKTNGKGSSSIGLTVFELWQNNCIFFAIFENIAKIDSYLPITQKR